jgi:hypothetical protein
LHKRKITGASPASPQTPPNLLKTLRIKIPRVLQVISAQSLHWDCVLGKRREHRHTGQQLLYFDNFAGSPLKTPN